MFFILFVRTWDNRYLRACRRHTNSAHMTKIQPIEIDKHKQHKIHIQFVITHVSDRTTDACVGHARQAERTLHEIQNQMYMNASHLSFTLVCA